MKMDTLDQRKRILLKLLLDSPRWRLGDLAALLHVSSKTVHSDIKHINLLKHNLAIKSRPGVGVWLEAGEDVRRALALELGGEPGRPRGNDAHQRTQHIAGMLLGRNRYLTMQEMGDTLFVSKATVNAQLPLVEEWLKKFNLQLDRRPNCGVAVVGEELDRRFALVSLLVERINTGSPASLAERLGEGAQGLVDHVSREEIRFLCRLVQDLEAGKGYAFREEHRINLSAHLTVLVSRLRQGCCLSGPAGPGGRGAKEGCRPGEEMARALESLPGIRLPEPEIGYLNMLLLGIVPESGPDKHDGELTAVLERVNGFLKERFGLDLQGDRQLYLGMSMHLAALFRRLKHGVHFPNPMLEEIKQAYPYAFHIALEMSSFIRATFKLELVEDEIGLVTLHLQAALERLKSLEKVRGYLVCRDNFGLNRLLTIRLQKAFPQLDPVPVPAPPSSLEPGELVISTVPLTGVSYPVAAISPLFTPRDRQLVEEALLKMTRSPGTDRRDFRVLRGYLQERFIFLNRCFRDKEQLIDFACDRLYRAGYVTEAYRGSALYREGLSSTYIGQGVALPHGFSQHIIQPVITVVQLREELNWSGEKVGLVFCCALDLSVKKDAEHLFEEIYELINHKGVLRQLKRARTVSEFMSTLSGKV